MTLAHIQGVVMLRRALKCPRLVNDSLKEPPNGCVSQRPGIGALDIRENFVLSFRLINGQSFSMFFVSDFKRAPGAFIQQLQQLLIQLVYSATPIFDAHDPRSLPC
jgi:hypothetical protein